MSTQHSSAVRRSIYESLAETMAALASPARLKVIQILAQSPRSVDEISREAGESVANTSQHLQKLAKMRVVSSERKGVTRIYRVSNSRVLSLWEDLQDLGHELNPTLDIAEAALTEPVTHAATPTKEILRDIKDASATLIDVREEHESSSTPVKNALSVPLSEIKHAKSLKDLGLSKAKPIYVVCRGRYCSLATEAVHYLRRWGCTAYRLRESSFKLNLISRGQL